MLLGAERGVGDEMMDVVFEVGGLEGGIVERHGAAEEGSEFDVGELVYAAVEKPGPVPGVAGRWSRQIRHFFLDEV